MRTVVTIFILCNVICSGQLTDEQRYLNHVKKRHNMVETSYNRGPWIDKVNIKYAWLKAPYCACGGSDDLEKLGAIYPPTRSASSRKFVLDASVDARRVWRGTEKIEAPQLAISTRKGGGHYIYVYKISGDTLFTFEYNTTPNGMHGSEWNGTWSGFKIRLISTDCSPANPTRITHFTKVIYDKAR